MTYSDNRNRLILHPGDPNDDSSNFCTVDYSPKIIGLEAYISQTVYFPSTC